MKDLVKLSKNHNIEANRYHGGAMDKIWRLLGYSRVTRWLSTMYDEKFDDEQLWSKLIEFLEKDVKIQQQKLSFCRRLNTDKPTDDRSRDTRRRTVNHNMNDSNDDERRQDDMICVLCGESGHVATNGPGGTKIIQYFACKTLTKSS